MSKTKRHFTREEIRLVQRIRVITDKQRAGETADALQRILLAVETALTDLRGVGECWDRVWNAIDTLEDGVVDRDVGLLRELMEALRDAERGN